MEGIPPAELDRLRSNLAAMRDRIASAESRAGRQEGACRLVAVTKSVPAEIAAALLDLGQFDLGESRPEVFLAKKDALGAAAEAARWHMIGHYQRRKIRDSVSHFALVHSVDTERLLAALDARGRDLDEAVEVLIQVNVTGEAAKQGFERDRLGPLWEAMERFPNVSVQGLMTMAPAGLESGALRRIFAELRSVRDRWACAERPLTELSMGMSGDFEEAVLEGAPLVRVGSSLFGGLERC